MGHLAFSVSFLLDEQTAPSPGQGYLRQIYTAELQKGKQKERKRLELDLENQ